MRIAIITCVCIALAHNVAAKKLPVGKVTLETVRASAEKGGIQKRFPGVILKFASQTRQYESFAMSDRGAVAVAILAPDRYCVAVFDEDRDPLTLEGQQTTCFVPKEGESIEVGVVLAAGPPQ